MAALTSRERLFLMAGVVALLAFAVYLLWPAENAAQVELAEAPPSVVPQTSFATAAAPAAMPTAPPAPPVNTATISALTLRGVMGGGLSGGAAIVAGADGSERVVRVGRELAPGLMLREVGVNYVIASSAGGEVRLELNKAGGALVSTASPAIVANVSGSAGSQAAARREGIELRLGLQAMRSKGRSGGYAIKAGTVPPRLQQAGLKPGDVILRVNGSELDEERLMELSWEMSNADRTEFEFIRNGQPMKASLQSNR
jgi:type II secretory pathway component PulC